MYFFEGLEEVRRLREGEITLRIGNGARVAAVVIETYTLQLSLGISLILKDCYFVPIASRNLIFVSMLAQDNYNFNSIKICIRFILEIKLLHVLS